MKTIKFIASIILVVSGLECASQNYEKVVLDDTNPDLGYYLAVSPRGPIEGVLVLLPGFGERPESVLPETKLHNTAFNNNILTLIIPFGNKIYADEPTINGINRALSDSIKRFRLSKDKFVIGGFSAGGTIALRYAELCKESPSQFPINPKAVFAIDSPVDIINLWDYFDREKSKNFSSAGVNEANFVQPIMEKELAGTPTTNLANFVEHSPFYAGSNAIGNEKYLKDIAVRVYHDMDVVWQLKNRRRSLYDNNALCSSELISRLLLQGNDQAEFIQSRNVGYRSNGMRHTHAWSIVDEVEFIQWMKEKIKG
jgi:pimeloyl-ACP methyl ester carboxylesterase